MTTILSICLGLLAVALAFALIWWIDQPDDYDDPTGDGDCDE